MRFHFVEHVPYETPAMIGRWVNLRGHVRSTSCLHAGDPLPAVDALDHLVIMGGPMGVHDVDRYGWLRAEKQFIRQVIDAGKPILGICLGAQLLAEALGATVHAGACREIGWFDVWLTDAGAGSPGFAKLPQRFKALHWHSDVFDIPPDAEQAARSAACENQAFVAEGGRLVGLQFHLDFDRAGLGDLVTHSRGALQKPGHSVQNAEALLATDAPFDQLHRLLFGFLDDLVSDGRASR
jgi:GMP synthase-like glutamine amidotransferase